MFDAKRKHLYDKKNELKFRLAHRDIRLCSLRCIQVPPQTVGKHNIVSMAAAISAGNTDSLYITSVVVMGTFTAFRGEKGQN